MSSIRILWNKLIFDAVICILLIIAIVIADSLILLKYIDISFTNIVCILIGIAVLLDSYYILKIKPEFYKQTEGKNSQYESSYVITYYFAIYVETIIGIVFLGYGLINSLK